MESVSTTAVEPQAQTPKPSSSLRAWRLWLPLSLQVALVCALAIPALQIEWQGKTVILKTVPVDPYDPLRGYSQTLSYDIARSESLKKLEGWKLLPRGKVYLSPNSTENLTSGMVVYVILQQPKKLDKVVPQPWQPIRIQQAMPTDLPDDKVAIRGVVEYGQVKYGLETYYMPEELSQQINSEVQAALKKNASSVEVKVGKDGRAIPIRLWVDKRSYRF